MTSAMDSLVGVIPVVITGGIVMKMTDALVKEGGISGKKTRKRMGAQGRVVGKRMGAQGRAVGKGVRASGKKTGKRVRASGKKTLAHPGNFGNVWR